MKQLTINKKILALISLSSVLLAGCSSNIAEVSKGSPTVAQAYDASMNDRTAYGSGITSTTRQATVGYRTRPVSLNGLPKIKYFTARRPAKDITQSTLNSQFPQLPNPESIMYIFGHYAGDEQLPVEGHFVPFNLYTRPYYALPSEVLTPYNDGQFISQDN